MDRESIKEKVLSNLQEYLVEPIASEQLSEDCRLVDDLGIESVKFIDLVLSFEQQFAIDIDLEKLYSIRTVGEIINLVEDAVNAKNS